MPNLQPASCYFWRSLPLAKQTGSAIFECLFRPQTDCVDGLGIATLLESPYPLPKDSLPEQAVSMARYSICAGAPRSLNGSLQLFTPELGKILPFLRDLGKFSTPKAAVTNDHIVALPSHLPFVGGWLGWLGYDLAWEIERLPWLKDDALPFPVAFWYEPAEFAVLDHHLQQLWLASDHAAGLERLTDKVLPLLHAATNATTSDAGLANDRFASIYIDKKDTDKKAKANLSPVAEGDKKRSRKGRTEALELGTNQQNFEQAVRLAKAHIRAGDVFQVNHSLRFRAQTNLPGWEVYRSLQAINPSPFASYWHTPWGAVVSCSPERLVHLKEGKAESRPIAGTRPRGKTTREDTDYACELKRDRKEQAEHIMLVDLERNDLGKVCQWGSVRVEDLMTIERYSHVMHLVSHITGQLDSKHSGTDLIASLFPGGTITGCPKVRCMEIIETLEPVRRSLFYGSCGYVDRRGRLDLNILIRTLLLTPKERQPSKTPPAEEPAADNADDLLTTTVWGQVGAGIVADSDPEREWLESLQKAKAQLLALGL
ncbi:MAG: chorismate-binding protein [Cyanobacteria bacterium J06554_11]